MSRPTLFPECAAPQIEICSHPPACATHQKWFLSKKWNMPHIWIRNAAHVNKSRHTYESVTICIWMSHIAQTWAYPHLQAVPTCERHSQAKTIQCPAWHDSFIFIRLIHICITRSHMSQLIHVWHDTTHLIWTIQCPVRRDFFMWHMTPWNVILLVQEIVTLLVPTHSKYDM